MISNNDAEPARLFNRNRHCRDRHIRMIRFVKIKHHFVIHFVNMVA